MNLVGAPPLPYEAGEGLPAAQRDALQCQY